MSGATLVIPVYPFLTISLIHALHIIVMTYPGYITVSIGYEINSKSMSHAVYIVHLKFGGFTVYTFLLVVHAFLKNLTHAKSLNNCCNQFQKYKPVNTDSCSVRDIFANSNMPTYKVKCEPASLLLLPSTARNSYKLGQVLYQICSC